jgi:hypothetical protein
MILRAPAFALIAALSAFSVAASAQSAPPQDSEHEASRKYPMTAADFQKLVGERIEQHRARMESHISSKQLPADKAEELRARFKAAVAQVNAKVDEVCADGTVTLAEAQEVHELARSLLHHHHASGGRAQH